jgi:class I fructose-bisphosphate aldolase
VIDFCLVLLDSNGNSPTDTRTTVTMGLGTTIRTARIFSHGSGSLFGAAIDHFVGYGDVRAGGLADLPHALSKIIAAGPDSVTMLAGTAKQLWAPYAGKAALIIQGGCFTADDRVQQLIATPEDAVRLGADALAVAIPVRNASEGIYLRWLTDSVRAAAPLEMPVVAHIYPRTVDNKIVFDPEGIAWAVRCGIETGVDVIKVGYPGDEAAFAEIIASCPTPIVMAGGPKTATFTEALQQIAEGQRAGARGAVVGRNMWGATDVTAAALAYKSVIHDGQTAEAAAALVPAEG